MSRLDIYWDNDGTVMNGPGAILKKLDVLAWCVVARPGRAAIFQPYAGMPKEVQFGIARSLAMQAWENGEVRTENPKASGEIVKYMRRHLNTAARSLQRDLKNQPLLIIDDPEDFEQETITTAENPLMPKRRRKVKPSGRRARSHRRARALHWQPNNREIEGVIDKMAFVKTYGGMALDDILVFAAMGATGNQREAARSLGISTMALNRRYSEARERFYEHYYDPNGTGERSPHPSR
jgi:hypothetical protein